MNMFYPTVSMLFHDKSEMLDSAGKISRLGNRTIYFGHGKPMPNKQWVKQRTVRSTHWALFRKKWPFQAISVMEIFEISTGQAWISQISTIHLRRHLLHVGCRQGKQRLLPAHKRLLSLRWCRRRFQRLPRGFLTVFHECVPRCCSSERFVPDVNCKRHSFLPMSGYVLTLRL